MIQIQIEDWKIENSNPNENETYLHFSVLQPLVKQKKKQFHHETIELN